jgi:hypothetical protein
MLLMTQKIIPISLRIACKKQFILFVIISDLVCSFFMIIGQKYSTIVYICEYLLVVLIETVMESLR